MLSDFKRWARELDLKYRQIVLRRDFKSSILIAVILGLIYSLVIYKIDSHQDTLANAWMYILSGLVVATVWFVFEIVEKKWYQKSGRKSGK